MSSIAEQKPSGVTRRFARPTLVSVPPWVTRVLGTLFCFETTLVFFINAGIYKNDPRFSWIPVDLTGAFFLVSLLTGCYILYKRGLPFRTARLALVWIFAALVVYAVLSILWTPSQYYAQTKPLHFATLTFWSLAGCALIVAAEPARHRRLFFWILVFSGWVALESLLAFMRGMRAGSYQIFVLALSTNYLGLGRTIGPGLVVALAYGLWWVRLTWQRWAMYVLCAGYAVLLLIIGGRGPFAATILGALVLLASQLRAGRTPRQLLGQFLLLVVLLAALIGTAAYYAQDPELLPSAVRRLRDIGENPRVRVYRETWENLENGPVFGQGIASWPVVMGHGDFRSYPHNVFLEIWFELGAIGLLLFLALLYVALRQLWPLHRLRGSPAALLALALFVNGLVNASTSGDVNENRFFFATIGLLMLATTAYRTERESKPDAEPAPPAAPRRA